MYLNKGCEKRTKAKDQSRNKNIYYQKETTTESDTDRIAKGNSPLPIDIYILYLHEEEGFWLLHRMGVVPGAWKSTTLNGVSKERDDTKH